MPNLPTISPNKPWRIAIVVQRYGEEVTGGAELLARWLAEHLQIMAEVHVITTCAIDYTTWANEYPPVETTLNGVKIHRFPVDSPRQWEKSMQETKALFFRSHTLFEEYAWLKDQGPYSTPLFDFLRQSYRTFDFFIFSTYIYAHAFFGLPLVADKAILIPNAHEDPFLYMPFFRHLFLLPRAIVYNTETEKQMVNRVMENWRVRQMVVGVGINEPESASADRFRRKFGIDGRFVLYLGRIDPAKNVPELLHFFQQYSREEDQPLKLVLAGKSIIPIPNDPNIISIGFVTEQEKFDALQAAEVLLMPSLYESLSMITMEAMLMETPALVNGRCEVLRQLCKQSNGGLYYNSYEEFRTTLNYLLENPHIGQQLGRQGRAYIRQTYAWDVITNAYRDLFQEMSKDQGLTRS